MRSRALIIAAFIPCCTVKSFSVNAQKIPSKPNIIYIMTDDMGYGDLSIYGRKDFSTPNIDRLAQQGIKFMQAYSAAPVCTPTRVALMTGKYPAKTPVGLKEPLVETSKDSAFGLTAEHPSLASIVRSNGYETILIGKWHLGFRPEQGPVKNGFDSFFGILSGAADYSSHKGDSRKTVDLFENETRVEKNGYLTEMFTDRAVEFLKMEHTKPFFLVLNYNAPHWPWQAPGDPAYPDSIRYVAGGSKQTYAAMMKSLDDGIGRVMETLAEKKLDNNTVVIFTNDNGGERYSDNGGLREGKMTLWEGGIRVPAMVRWPGIIEAGSTTSQPIITMDWTATIIALSGEKKINKYNFDGQNLLPVLTKNIKMDRTFYWRIFQRKNQKAMREGDWKYIKDDKGEYLYNLATDPGEKNNIADLHPEVFLKLQKKYEKWEASVLKPIPL